jgi:hypothetical protein
MFLQIGTTAHVRAEAGTASFRRGINLSHGDLL